MLQTFHERVHLVAHDQFSAESLEAVKERYALPLERIFADVTSPSAGGVR